MAQLLVEFFRFFAWQFDFRHSVVSVRQPHRRNNNESASSSGLSKLDKAEHFGWLQSDILR